MICIVLLIVVEVLFNIVTSGGDISKIVFGVWVLSFWISHFREVILKCHRFLTSLTFSHLYMFSHTGTRMHQLWRRHDAKDSVFR